MHHCRMLSTAVLTCVHGPNGRRACELGAMRAQERALKEGPS